MSNDPILSLSDAQKYLGPVKNWAEMVKDRPEYKGGIPANQVIYALANWANLAEGKDEKLKLKKALQHAVDDYPEAAKIVKQRIEHLFINPNLKDCKGCDKEAQGRLDLLNKAMAHKLAYEAKHVEEGSWVIAPNVGTAKSSTRQV